MFYLPMSVRAFNQIKLLSRSTQDQSMLDERERWTYKWDSHKFSSQKAYKYITKGLSAPQTFAMLWKSKCQPKQKVFFWLFLHNHLNTRAMLRIKNGVGFVHMWKLYYAERRNCHPSLLKVQLRKKMLADNWSNYAKIIWHTQYDQIDFATVGQKVESGDSNSHDVVHMEMHKWMGKHSTHRTRMASNV
jgi:hypothetical protein